MTRYAHLTDAASLGINVLDTLTRILHLEGTERGDQYDILCPAHEDRRPSASVNLDTGFWHCLSCGAGGDLVLLGVRVLGLDREAVRDMLQSRTPIALLARLESLTAAVDAREPTTAPMEVPVPHMYARGPLDELLDRGFDEATLRRWSVRYVSSETLDGQNGLFNIYASIGIPVMDTNARVLFWCYRRTEQSGRWQPRYLYSGGARMLREAWFGVQHHQQGDIVIVEGALDAMWCDQCGVPALALLGASMGAGKAVWLGEHFDTVTLLGDYDAAGAQAVARLGAALAEMSCQVRVAQYYSWMDAHDPQELAPVDLELMVDRAITWNEYLYRRTRRAVINEETRL